jgi:hypothetical protein
VLEEWLQPTDRPPEAFAHFRVIDIAELDAPSGAVKDYLRDLLHESAVDLGFLEDVTRRLGWAKAEAIVRQRLPANSTARRGRFGEVVGVFMLNQFNGYIVPIEKAHFAITGGQSQPSTDAVLLRVDDTGVTEVCFVESKLRTRADNFASVEGVQQLQADYDKEIPDMLAFTAARLFDRGEPLYEAFMEYMSSREDERDRDSFRLLLFYDVTVWSERCLNNLEDEAPTASPLTVHTIHVTDLADLVSDVFNRAGVSVVDDEP